MENNLELNKRITFDEVVKHGLHIFPYTFQYDLMHLADVLCRVAYNLPGIKDVAVKRRTKASTEEERAISFILCYRLPLF